jgi:hypothetical protein
MTIRAWLLSDILTQSRKRESRNRLLAVMRALGACLPHCSVNCLDDTVKYELLIDIMQFLSFGIEFALIDLNQINYLGI